MPDPKDPKKPPDDGMPPMGGPAPGSGFKLGIDPALSGPVMDFFKKAGQTILMQGAKEAREFAKEGGTACSMPDCDAFTMGTRCESCGRRTCLDHTYRRLEGVKPVPYCIHCVIRNHPECFEVEGEDGSEAK